jgi:hypothetical protein
VIPYQHTDEISSLRALVADTPKTSDVVFVGVGSSSRQAVITALRESGVSVDTPWGFGEDRDAKIAAAKVLLNVHFDSAYNIFESIRCDRWLMAGNLVVSQPSLTLQPYDLETPTLIWGRSSSPQDMVLAVKGALARWEELHAAGLAYAREPSPAVRQRAQRLETLLDGIDSQASIIQAGLVNEAGTGETSIG